MQHPKTRIMGILNCTPDSFYDGGKHYSPETAVAHGLRLASEGADTLDIGGESTRPGAIKVEEEEELCRVLPVLKALHAQVNIPLSIDTRKPSVAERALEAGATLLNDVGGFSDPAMRRLAADAYVEVCVMHMQGTPETMQMTPSYPEGVIQHLLRWFQERIEILKSDGIHESKIILDPGIGFGKSVADNMEIIHNLHLLKGLGFPILIGLSRKSFLGKILRKPASELLAATLAANMMAIHNGAGIIRVHEVREHRDMVEILHYAKHG